MRLLSMHISRSHEHSSPDSIPGKSQHCPVVDLSQFIVGMATTDKAHQEEIFSWLRLDKLSYGTWFRCANGWFMHLWWSCGGQSLAEAVTERGSFILNVLYRIFCACHWHCYDSDIPASNRWPYILVQCSSASHHVITSRHAVLSWERRSSLPCIARLRHCLYSDAWTEHSEASTILFDPFCPLSLHFYLLSSSLCCSHDN